MYSGETFLANHHDHTHPIRGCPIWKINKTTAIAITALTATTSILNLIYEYER
jgi:hypothetical protein